MLLVHCTISMGSRLTTRWHVAAENGAMGRVSPTPCRCQRCVPRPVRCVKSVSTWLRNPRKIEVWMKKSWGMFHGYAWLLVSQSQPQLGCGLWQPAVAIVDKDSLRWFFGGSTTGTLPNIRWWTRAVVAPDHLSCPIEKCEAIEQMAVRMIHPSCEYVGPFSGVGKCPNWTSPNYWGYNLQQIWEGDVQNPQKGTFTNPCFLKPPLSDSRKLALASRFQFGEAGSHKPAVLSATFHEYRCFQPSSTRLGQKWGASSSASEFQGTRDSSSGSQHTIGPITGQGIHSRETTQSFPSAWQIGLPVWTDTHMCSNNPFVVEVIMSVCHVALKIGFVGGFPIRAGFWPIRITWESKSWLISEIIPFRMPQHNSMHKMESLKHWIQWPKFVVPAPKFVVPATVLGKSTGCWLWQKLL